MKYRLIGLLLLIGVFVNAQIGIDLTEMIPAPDSGYMIITTGDEYPDRGLQKYVKATEILGIDTLFQNGDSLCILMRSEEKYRCFPVHQEVRLEKVDGGLRVCWESRDTVWETRNYLHFPGTSGSYVEARDIHDFEIGDEDAEIEVEGLFSTETDANSVFFSTGGATASQTGYYFRVRLADFSQVMFSGENARNVQGHSSSLLHPEELFTLKVKWDSEEKKDTTFIDGTIAGDRSLDYGKIENHGALTLGKVAISNAWYLTGRIYNFRFNDEYILFEESYGRDTLITNKGTVLDILGDVEWRLDTLGFTSIDTSHHCEIIPLTDTRLINVEHIGDSVRYTLSDSTIFTVRDSFIPQENIIGWIDDRIPDTVFFAKTSTATKAIEFGDTLELKGGAININIPVEIDYFPATNQLQVCWTEIDLPEGGLQQKPGLGEEFGQQENETQQLPADTIRLCDTIQLNDVFIDTVIHDGAGWVFYRNDGKVWAVRDSFRTDDEILDLIEMMNDPQWLTIDRDGNEVTISISDGNDVSFIDSVRTDADIAKVMRDSIDFPVDILIDDFFRDGDSLFIHRSDSALFSANIRPTIDQIFDPCGINLIDDSHFFRGDESSARRFIINTYAQVDTVINGIAHLETISTSGASRFEYIFSDLIPGRTYTASLLTDIPLTSSTNGWRSLINANKIEEGRIIVSDSLFLHWVLFQPTDESGSLRAYYGDIGIGTQFDLHYFMLQECDRPSHWRPSLNDLHQDLTGIRDTLSTHDARLLSLEYFRDTLGIPDIASFYHDGDSIHLTMKDGRSWVVPDKHFTEQEIKDLIAQESPVNHSWLLKDGGVPDNATDTVFRDGVAVIEGDVYDRYMTGDQDKYVWDGESGSPVLLQYVQDQSGNDMAGQLLAPNAIYAISLINSENQTEFESIQMHLGSGIVFLNYGQGNRIGDPDYLLGVDASGYIKEVRPTSGIDTIIHLGDSVFFDFDDKTFTIRDNVRSDAEIISLIEANRIFQQLGRSGDFITLTDGGQVLDLHLKNVTHTGDSIRFHLSDGRTLTTRDSSLSVETVRDMILEEIPETVFYVKQGDVTAPVNWGDIVELENGTVNVNMPTKVKMIDSLNALEVCIWQVVDRTVVDTAIMDYLYFNGVDAYGESVLPNADNPFDLPAGFRVSFDDPINQEQTLYSNGGEVNNNQFSIRIPSSLEDISLRVSGSNIIRMDVDDLSPGEVDLIEYKPIGDNIGGYLNGELKDQIPGFNYPFVGVGARQLGRYNSTNPRLFKGKIYEFWWGDNHYPITEGSGTTITSTTGAEFNLFNTVWGKDTIIAVNELIDTFFQCDTVYLKDWYVKNATFENDTLTLVRSDGIEMSVEIQASGGDGIDTMYSTQDSLYILTSTGRTLSAGVAKGDKGDGLEYHWDGTRLGVRVENSGDPFVYVDLKGDKGDTGEDGREVELRVDSEMIQWRYVGESWQNLLPLSALKGEKGDTGPGLEYAWDGTKLGVRVEGSGDPFVYVDLKGEKGDPGDVVGDINIYKDDGVILEDRTAIIEEDNTLRFDLKEKAGFEIGHYSQDGNDSKLINHRTSDNSFMLEIQEIEKDTLWNSRILATSKGIGLRNHKSHGSSISYGTMGVDTMGSYILNLVKDNPGVLFAGRRQFLNRVTDDGHALWDTIGITDIGITPADTARWGAGGGGEYTLSKTGYETHLRDGSGASKGFFQIGGQGGIEVYNQSNNMYRVSLNHSSLPQWSLAFSNNALQLRRDNMTQSTVGFVGTGGINIQSTAGSLTIDGSSIGGTQSLSFSPSLAQTTLSGGGGSFRLVGSGNTSVSLSSGGVYTISSTGGDNREIVRGGTNNDWIMMSGSSVGVVDRYVSSFSKNGNNITLNRTDGIGGVTFNIADGDSDPNNEIQTFSHNTTNQTSTLSRSGGSLRFLAGSNMSISNTSAGVYTFNASVPSYTFETNNNVLALKRNGVIVSTLDFRGMSGIHIAASGTANDRVLAFHGSASPFTTLASPAQSINSGTAIAKAVYSTESAGIITLPLDVEEGTRRYITFDGQGEKIVDIGDGRTVVIQPDIATGFIFHNGKWFPMK